MARTTALYYPHIDIHDNNWLMTALLYWDSVATIFPDGMAEYETQVCRDLHTAGYLEQVVVESDDPAVRSVSEQMLDHLTSPSFPRALARRDAVVPLDGAGPSQDILDRAPEYVFMHPSKMAGEFRRYLRDLGHLHPELNRDDGQGPMLVSAPVANHYMTLLAERKSHEFHMALATYESLHEDSVREARAANYLNTLPYGLQSRRGRRGLGGRRDYRQLPPQPSRQLAEGVMAHIVLDALRVHPSTDVYDVVRFREDHEMELAEFRKVVAGFGSTVEEGLTDAALYQAAMDYFKTEIRPSTSRLKARLKESRIRATWGALKSTAFTRGGTFALGVALSAIALGPYALVAAGGLSIVLTAIAYRQDRAALLRDSKYSYVLSLENHFGGTRPIPD